jgi:hypothetical protein
MPHKGQRTSNNPKKKRSTKNGEEKSEIGLLDPGPLVNEKINASNKRNSNNNDNITSQVDDLSDSVYVRYKKSTQRFKEALQALVPSTIFESDRVQVLMDAADYMSENALPVDEALLQDLKYTIRVRKRITCEKFDGGDAGHSYFISVLCYCWSVLAPLCPRKKKEETPVESTSRSPKEEEKSSVHNRFASLAIGDEDQGEEEDNEDDLPQYSSKPSRPVETNAKDLTLQEIMTATDFTDCVLFLLTMDKYMEFNCMQYSMLKKKCTSNDESKGPSPSGIARDLIQIGVGTNTNIQRLAALEQRFNQDYPHLDTPYRLLAKLIFSDSVQNISKIVHRLSSVSSRFQEKDALMFVGDTLECAFRSKSDPNNKSSHLVGNFCKRWKISDASEVDQLFQSTYGWARIEAPTKKELDMNLDVMKFYQHRGLSNHSWLPFRFIGGKERSITQTLRLLQGLPSVITENEGRLSMKQGYFGLTWNKISKRPITTIPNEMDELLMGDIMPVLINICYEGVLGKQEVPKEKELLPLISQIKLFIKYPDRPVTWTLVFAIHSILSSIFESQGSKYLSYIADTASSTFNQYIQQIKSVKEAIIPQAPRRHPIYEQNLKTALLLEHLPLIPMHAANICTMTDGQMQRALWNPVCAGCTLAFVAYFGNVEVGSNMIDSIAQFRAWMHIYNALLQTGNISRGEIPLLDFLYEKFEKCKAVWEGPFPARGQFVTRWWISFGKSVDAAQKYNTSPSQKSQARNNQLRTLTPILPQSFMKSYKRICMREYTDETDKYQTDEQRQDWKRLYNTMVAIEEDEPLLAFNWISLGHYLNDAYVQLFENCGWMSEVDSLIESTSDEIRMGRRMDLRVVKSADSWLASDENLKYHAFSHFLAILFFDPLDKHGTGIAAVNAVAFMKQYFSNIPLSNIQWFESTV